MKSWLHNITTSTAQAQPLAPSLFVYNGGPYVAATHANGFEPVAVPITSGSSMQRGTASPLPLIKIGGSIAMVQYAGLNITPGEFQFNVVVPPDCTGWRPADQPGTLVTFQH